MRSARLRGLALAAALAPLVACSGTDCSQYPQASCADTVTYRGVSYSGTNRVAPASHVDSARLDAVLPACNDNPCNDAKDEPVKVRPLDGVSPEVALARDGEDPARVYVRDGAALDQLPSWVVPEGQQPGG